MPAVCDTLPPPGPRTRAAIYGLPADSSERIAEVVSELFSDPAVEDDLRNWLNGGHHELIPTNSGIPIVAMRRMVQPMVEATG